ncbi:MAG: hypothetical protein DRJ01_17600 [Bacteroidetes bacterium]|nr:MAG: hypothetical protein DRJ01_17600 [Bacteroidota bacterium]
MHFKDELLKICKDYPHLQFEFLYKIWETDFLRFYQSQTNYNISKTSITLYTSVHKGKKSYSFSLKNPSQSMVLEKIKEAEQLIDHLPEDPDFVDIEKDLTKSSEKEKTNNINIVSLNKKINILSKIADAVKPYNFKIYGSFICNYNTTYIINSNDVNKRNINSPIMLELKAVSDKNQVTVLESYGSENISNFNLDLFIEHLVAKVKSAQNDLIDITPGEYEVILAPRCMNAYWVNLLGSMHAHSLDVKNSFFEDKLDKKVFPDFINLTDDPTHPDLINFDYSGNGHIYRKLKLIENGVFLNFLVDNYYAHKLGLKENGAEGEALVMGTGDKSLAKMIGSVKRGLYISSLHYMNFINHKETSLTGLTRDGTFLIEDGKISKIVNNLRFTEKISDIINGITEIENRSYTVPSSTNYGEFSIYSSKIPHVKVKGFKISSSTKTI